MPDPDPRLTAYATQQGLSQTAARRQLVTVALDYLARREAAGAARGQGRWAGTTPEQRRAAAQQAARARWAPHQRGS